VAGRRLLAVQLKRLGDLVLARPALRAMAASGARVTLLTSAPFDQALRLDPWLDEIRLHPPGWASSIRFGASLARDRFDAAIDFEGGTTSARLAWQSGAPVRIGWRLRGRRLAYTTSLPAREDAPPRHTSDRKMDLVRALGIDGTVHATPLVLTADERAAGRARLGVPGALVALPASRRDYKRWPPERTARLLDDFVTATGAPVVLAGGPGENDQLEAVATRMARRPPVHVVDGIRPLMGFLTAARAVVAPDGGARQLAEALDVPSLALFGPQEPAHWTRLGSRHRAVRGRRADCAGACRSLAAPCALPGRGRAGNGPRRTSRTLAGDVMTGASGRATP
jgi:ADP-heptose:LPS heptosyltransferase